VKFAAYLLELGKAEFVLNKLELLKLAVLAPLLIQEKLELSVINESELVLAKFTKIVVLVVEVLLLS